MLEIKKNNQTIQLRNLQEQVQKNKEDIARHYAIDRALANLGIEIVGQVSTPEELPNPGTYTGFFGDTYAVGNKAEVDAGISTYMYYVYTRADLNAGQPGNYWLNVGSISIEGPQGPQGPVGPAGPQGKAGSEWNTGALPNISGNINDFYLVTTGGGGYIGDVYRITENGPVLMGNIRGPQGPAGAQGIQGEQGERGEQGPKGNTGDVGGFINIYGIVTNINQLPDPNTLDNRTIAYLFGTGFPYDLYIQVGDADGPVTWVNAGPLNVSTLVKVDGQYQNVWDADTKLDKVTASSSYQRIYGISPGGEPYIFNVGESALGFAIAKRISDGSIIVPLIPGGDAHAASKKYVDDNKGTKLYEHKITGVSGTATTGETITDLILVSTSPALITGGGETALSRLYLDSINSYIPYYGKITYILDYFLNQVTVQFHNRINGGEVESMILDVENMVDTVTAL